MTIHHAQSANVWVVLRPAEDLPGTWLAICLDLDLVDQGATPEEAYRHLCDALALVVMNCVDRGVDPFDVYNSAPEEDWELMRSLTRHGRFVGDNAEAAGPVALVQVRLSVVGAPVTPLPVRYAAPEVRSAAS